MPNYLVPRHKVLIFYGLPIGQSGSSVQWTRLHYHTELTINRNPEEYERKYVDEATKRSDIVAYATSISYGFDKFTGDAVQSDLLNIINNEKTGEDAIRKLAIVDISTVGSSGTATAYIRDYSVIPGSEGDDENAYTYSGEFKAAGELSTATVSSTSDWETFTINT